MWLYRWAAGLYQFFKFFLIVQNIRIYTFFTFHDYVTMLNIMNILDIDILMAYNDVIITEYCDWMQNILILRYLYLWPSNYLVYVEHRISSILNRYFLHEYILKINPFKG